MHDHDTIPYGYCHCGCGERTKPARQSDTRKGWVRGEPMKYIAGHHQRLRPLAPVWDSDLNCYRIPLSSTKYRGRFALVDADDIDLVRGYRWYLRKNGRNFYAFSQTYTQADGKRPVFSMHRMVLGFPGSDLDVDHINHDGLDNRRENLRLVSHQENMMNQRGWSGAKSQYKGVVYEPRYGRWYAKLNTDGTHYFLGSFRNEVDAAKAYDAKAREVFGEHAYLNFPKERKQR